MSDRAPDLATGEGTEVTSRELGDAFDLLAAWAPGGFAMRRAGLGVAGSGVAQRITVEGGRGRCTRLSDAVAERLARVGGGAIAVGGVPFRTDRPAGLVIPARAVLRTREGGPTREVRVSPVIEPASEGDAGWAAASAPGADAAATITSEPSPQAYREAVLRATGSIRAGTVRKVVLARSLIVDTARPFDVRKLLARLAAVDPDCYAFAVPDGDDATLVGASPELLARVRGRVVETTPLAGSAPRGADRATDAAAARGLLESDKDRIEHQLVVEDVVEALGPLCDDLEFPEEPVTVATANVWHLATPFRGRLRSEVRGVLAVVDALHPTAAVSGLPREDAAHLLGALEHLDRGGYAGPIGWVDASGDGEFAIALRCALVEGSRARLFAGAGIVAESDPDRELDETERKFRALVDALRWG